MHHVHTASRHRLFGDLLRVQYAEIPEDPHYRYDRGSTPGLFVFGVTGLLDPE